jgi:hypothetical protein
MGSGVIENYAGDKKQEAETRDRTGFSGRQESGRSSGLAEPDSNLQLSAFCFTT